MVKTNSMFLELGTQLPSFEMINTNSSNQENYNLTKLDDRHLLLMFICAHCPFVKYIENYISILSSDIEDKVQTIAVSSNDIVTHPSDSPDCLRNQAQLQGWSFPYLYDESQVFAKELKAACTPDFYLFSMLEIENLPFFIMANLIVVDQVMIFLSLVKIYMRC
jgi:peroxiredoxin